MVCHERGWKPTRLDHMTCFPFSRLNRADDIFRRFNTLMGQDQWNGARSFTNIIYTQAMDPPISENFTLGRGCVTIFPVPLRIEY